MKPVNEKKNVAVIGMHPVACIGLEELLRNELNLNVAVWPFQHPEAVGASTDVANQQVDLIISELDGSGALVIARQVQTAKAFYGQDTPILILSELNEPAFGPLCIVAGARGFVSKSSPIATIAQAIDTVLRGGWYISPLIENAALVQEALAQNEENNIAYKG